MRVLAVLMILLGLGVSSCHGKVLVWPVVIEAHGVNKGDVFTIHCSTSAEHSQKVQLDLALFDQTGDGQVYFLEDQESIVRARSIVQVGTDEFLLEPHGKKTVTLQLLDDSFSSAYVVLFVNSRRDDGVNTRLAVLLLLSTEGAEESMGISDLKLQNGVVYVTFQNTGDRHGLLSGRMVCYDDLGGVVEEVPITSGRVLPQRSRSIELALPGHTRRVHFSPLEVGLGI